MSLPFQSADSVKQALYEELQNILSPVKEIRNAAENRMKHLEFTEGYGVYLAEIIMNQSFDLSLRQLAAVMLTKYAEDHWNAEGAEGVEVTAVAPDQAKQMIRKILPNGLYDPNSKIRVSVAYTISTIASSDWPNTWTELFDIIVKCLGGNEDSIHGAMQVLVEFTHNLNNQISIVGPIILSEIYRIFEAEQVYSTKTRSCAVTIFKSLLKSINEFIDTKEEKAKMLDPVLPIFINKLIQCLNTPTGPNNSFELKTEIIKVLAYMVNDMPKVIVEYNSQVMPVVWQLLTQTADVYVNAIVNDNKTKEFDNSNDDEMGNFTNLVLQLIEFIHSLIEKKRFHQSIKPVLTDIVYISIVYMQLTNEQIQKWSSDAELYVDDFNIENCECTIRLSSNDIITNIADEFGGKVFLPTLNEALTRHVNVAEAEKTSGNPNWWKIIEASVTSVGSLKGCILENEDSKFNLKDYLIHVKTLLGSGGNGIGYQQDVSPFLHGKCLWLLCHYSDAEANIYDPQTLQEILNCVANNLSATKPMIIQISAIRALHELCTNLKTASNEQRAMVIDKLAHFVTFITDIATRAKNNVLSELLMTIATVTAFDKNFTANSHSRLISFTIAIFLKYSEDPFLLEQVQEILEVLSENEFCIGPLQEKLVPTLVSILNLDKRPDSDNQHLMQDTALDILQTIVKHSQKPLSTILIDVAFPATVKCILSTDDHAIMQSGGECLRAFINASPEQICSYNNGEGLNYIMQVTTLLLNPMSNEFTAAFVGRLVITIVSKAGNYLGDNIHLLLKAVISKMQLVDALSVIMSLVVTFAHLVVTQMEAVLNFLSTVPGPTGEPAIQFVLSQWLTRQQMFYGTYERKISTMALCKLFEHGVTTNDARITSVTIRDLVEIPTPAPSNKPRTRLQVAALQQWIAVPALVKIFKLLVNELHHLKGENLVEEYETDDDGDDDDEGLLDDSGNIIGSPNRSTNVFRSSDLWYDDGEDEDNQMLQELLPDPAFANNLEENLTKFLQNFAQTDKFCEYVNQLTDSEKLVLRSIQVNV